MLSSMNKSLAGFATKSILVYSVPSVYDCTDSGFYWNIFNNHSLHVSFSALSTTAPEDLALDVYSHDS